MCMSIWLVFLDFYKQSQIYITKCIIGDYSMEYRQYLKSLRYFNVSNNFNYLFLIISLWLTSLS